jgi:hypothetical protein
MPFRIDTLPIGKLDRASDGSLRGDVVATRAGVFLYRGPSGEPIHEFRPPAEVFNADSLASAAMLPITVEHPKEVRVTPDNASRVSVGMTGQAVRQDGQNVVLPIRVVAREGISAIDGGKRQLSLGYQAEVTRADGVFEGQPYTHMQSEIRYNHLAITDKARAGDVASVRLDAADAIMVDDAGGASPPAPPERSAKMPGVQIRLDNGCNYEVPAEVEAAYKAGITQRTELQTKLDAVTAERDTATKDLATMTAQRDEAKASLEKLEKTDNAEQIKAGVKARLALESAAARAKLDKAITDKLDSMSDDEIRLAVIQSRHKDFDAKDKSPEYIAARFDAVVETLGTETDNGKTIAGDGSKTRADAEGAREKAIARMHKRSRGEKEE